MRTYVVLLDGGKREQTVEVTDAGEGRYDVRIGGHVHRVDAFRADPATWSLIVDRASYAAQLDAGAAGVKVHVRDETFVLDVLDERRMRMREASTRGGPEGTQLVTAPMAGKVVKLLAAKGDTVRQGQGLVVIAAMKMENVIKSPKDGKLSELHVVEGQAVEGGARLAAVE